MSDIYKYIGGPFDGEERIFTDVTRSFRMTRYTLGSGDMPINPGYVYDVDHKKKVLIFVGEDTTGLHD